MDVWKRIGTSKDLNYFLELEEYFNYFFGLAKYFTNVLHDVILLFSDIFSESNIFPIFINEKISKYKSFWKYKILNNFFQIPKISAFFPCLDSETKVL